MSPLLRSFFLVAFVIVSANASPRVAVATMSPGLSVLGSPIAGQFLFAEDGDTVQVAGGVVGVPAVSVATLQIHEFGNIASCDTSGPQFIPTSAQNAANTETIVLTASVPNNLNMVNFTGALNYSLRGGRNGILGRTAVVSTTEGNFGRIACGVIGIQAGDWSSAVTNTPSLLLFVVAALFAYSRA